MPLITRQSKGQKLTIDELDGNFEYLQSMSGVQTIKVRIPYQDVLQLNTTPYELIPAPGEGKFIQVLSIVCYLEYATTTYTTNGYLIFLILLMSLEIFLCLVSFYSQIKVYYFVIVLVIKFLRMIRWLFRCLMEILKMVIVI